MKVAASIVIYRTRLDIISGIVSELQKSVVDTIYVINNSPNFDIGQPIEKSKFILINNKHNMGFGAAHNIALNKSINLNYDYHFVINPDVQFSYMTINNLINYISNNTKIGLLMPRVLNFDGTVQYLPKLLPTFLDMIIRRVKFPKNYYYSRMRYYELRNNLDSTVLNIPLISGCFSLFNIKALNDVGVYDERFFMYLEDWDLSRRIHEQFDTIYYPFESIFHGYASESSRNIKLLFIHISSMIKYFNKWGWFFDFKRNQFNQRVLSNSKFSLK